MNTKKIIIASIIILVILASAVFFYFFIFKAEKRSDLEEERLSASGGGKVGPFFSDAEYQKQLSAVVKTGDFVKCDEIQDDFYKKVCVNNVAVELAKENIDLSYCKKVDGELIYESYCNEQVLLLKFEKEETGDFCKELQSAVEQENCLINFYNRLALRKNDADICQNIADTKQAELCYDNHIVSKSFAQSPEGFDCALLKSEDSKSDCGIAKLNFSNGEPMPPGMNEKCLMLKTRIFTQFCL